MQLRNYAESIIAATTLEGKLRRPPPDLEDSDGGEVLRLAEPQRPPELAIVPARGVKVPPIAGMQDLSQRRRILHALANHELQAAELFAWAILAFPDSPKSFRRGLLSILIEEQEHCELYLERLTAFGGDFGDYPVTGHFWNRIGAVTSPIDFVCVMGLTFENANLDFAGDYSRAAREVGDEATALAIDKIHDDEIGHVAFAWRWLSKWKPATETCWQTYERTISLPLSISRARGAVLDREARVAAGIDEEFLGKLEAAHATRPNGNKR